MKTTLEAMKRAADLILTGGTVERIKAIALLQDTVKKEEAQTQQRVIRTTNLDWKERYLQVTAQTCRAEDEVERLQALLDAKPADMTDEEINTIALSIYGSTSVLQDRKFARAVLAAQKGKV